MILYRNSQWMVQDEPRGRFVVEVNTDNPNDTEGKYWFPAAHLKHAGEHSTIMHMAEKNWVDLGKLQEAVNYALNAFSIEPDYDVDREFREAFKYSAAIKAAKPIRPGLYRLSEIPDIDDLSMANHENESVEAVGKP